jgi:hypothetical protein
VKDEVYVLLMSITPDNSKDQIQTVIAKVDHSLLHSLWHEVGYCLDVYRATNGAHTELA